MAKIYKVQVQRGREWGQSIVSMTDNGEKPVTKQAAIKWAKQLDSRTQHYRAVCETVKTTVIWEAKKKRRSNAQR